MNTPQLHRITAAGKTWSMKGLRPSEKVLLLAARIAEYEKPKGVTRDELRAATGLPESSFDRAWTFIRKHELTERL